MNIMKSSIHQNCLKSKDEIIKFIQQGEKYFYYSGHGHQNGDLAIEMKQNNYADRFQPQLFFSNKQKSKYISIKLDCCYSGKFVRRFQKFHSEHPQFKQYPMIWSLCGENQVSADIKGYGGVLMWLCSHRMQKHQKKKKMIDLLIQQKGMILDNGKAAYFTKEICQYWFGWGEE